ANLPTRIAFRVASYVDSRTILDRVGAEMLLGKGDMLMMRPGADLPRAQGAYVDEREVGKLVRFWESAAEPVFDTGMLEEEQPLPFVGPGNGAAPRANGAARAPKGGDSLLPQARELIIREQKASTSMLQTEMGLGYQRARRIVAELERQGVVGPARGAQPRDVLVAPPS
ncbi:MAG: DNA translocase FtsK, partial [Acidobacteriota bacterium]|nr:DNA translocase FtsK [Acidobacteriota bacterium]